jgi:hypothetical protein
MDRKEMVVAKQAKKQSKKAAHDGARSMVDQRDDPTQCAPGKLAKNRR